MGFYSELLETRVDCIYFNKEEEADNTALALYNGETFSSASRFSPCYENEPYPYNIAQNFIRNNLNGMLFVQKVFEREVKKEIKDETVIKNRYFPSVLISHIYNQAYEKAEQDIKKESDYLKANPYNNYDEFLTEVIDALDTGERLVKNSGKENNREFVNQVVSEVKDLIRMIMGE